MKCVAGLNETLAIAERTRVLFAFSRSSVIGKRFDRCFLGLKREPGIQRQNKHKRAQWDDKDPAAQ